jgi:hypothetical protein
VYHTSSPAGAGSQALVVRSEVAVAFDPVTQVFPEPGMVIGVAVAQSSDCPHAAIPRMLKRKRVESFFISKNYSVM